jgi:hypothetical protein
MKYSTDARDSIHAMRIIVRLNNRLSTKRGLIAYIVKNPYTK